jgi:hypothetical protein
MTAAVAELLARCRATGLSLTAEGEALHVDYFDREPPAELLEELRRHKPALLAILGEAPEADSPAAVIAPAQWFEDPAAEPPYREPCAARRGLIRRRDRQLEHFCAVCGAWGAFGYDSDLLAGHPGRWFCFQHRPPEG